MAQETESSTWRSMMTEAGPYPLEAFNFVREGLNFTVSQLHRDPEAVPESSRHISGQQLSMGLRDYAINQYGMLAPQVLSHWHIRKTDDFGRIVFAMIDHGLMSKNSEDSIDDFRGVYDFDEAFAPGELHSRMTCGI
jgi:uncharacterized repeat protein (TIGR04138 family)